jgi:hypothetical protein
LLNVTLFQAKSDSDTDDEENAEDEQKPEDSGPSFSYDFSELDELIKICKERQTVVIGEEK